MGISTSPDLPARYALMAVARLPVVRLAGYAGEPVYVQSTVPSLPTSTPTASGPVPPLTVKRAVTLLYPCE
ncbi:MAG: hypothetical protein BWY79_01449 [Actinobacteria bacterium ADurb.Bin444]|nr:MAG: hypothetical protein BWY79_01449 [Actinobacteria bacterium ADurb.Bin444]